MIMSVFVFPLFICYKQRSEVSNKSDWSWNYFWPVFDKVPPLTFLVAGIFWLCSRFVPPKYKKTSNIASCELSALNYQVTSCEKNRGIHRLNNGDVMQHNVIKS